MSKRPKQSEYNENRLERVYGGMKQDERDRLKAQPCTFCNYHIATRRWASGCPHHDDEVTAQCSICYLFNSCSFCHRTAHRYAELEDGHIPYARHPERIERLLWLYSDELDFPSHIMEHYDVW